MLRPLPTAPPAPDAVLLLGDLKRSLARCAEAELLLVAAWVQAELGAQHPRPALRLVRTPSAYAPADWSGTFADLAGRLRRDLHELSHPELVVLHGWIRDRLHRTGV